MNLRTAKYSLLGAGWALLASTVASLAQDAAPAAADAAAAAAPAAPVLNSGDTAWMLVSSVLVLFMIVPGLVLFYGGLVRAKNMLSVLMQGLLIASIVMVAWVFYGYSLAFTDGGPFIGGLSKAFLAGIAPDTLSGTIPEYVFVCFQMTFAAITPALIIGAFAERMKFSAVLLFSLLWLTFIYAPIAHTVWQSTGYMFQLGALDFAGGTVVHINAGIAGLVGAILVGKRIGLGKELMAPHSLTLSMVGAAMLWVGWFGFNAGSALSAGPIAGLATINTFVATAGAAIGWCFIEWIVKGKPSMLGAISGVVAGLVAVTPAAGFAGPVGSIVLGFGAAIVCFFFVTTVKNAFGYDDALDVFGVHCVGGIVGAIATGILVSPSLGGVGIKDYAMGHQVWVQIQAVLFTLVWSAVGSAILFKIVDVIIGLRVRPEVESEGLDIVELGERAYHS
ncbi:ammonium transporter [Kaistia dalseonensis]|uniref:Ammonium transporter n=1 Tax=Kaistia dalseonensis TaxID=410840 RepID=A0ABU0H4R5_9HYPH|nr:ammonium transporter [Kaistia dalseonensis]MCX5494723.1 ammonium transporter [Kaistia dalseonensis]MDQ0437304.1 Amt family ammonium transporter [Kaistia dalseonensis]